MKNRILFGFTFFFGALISVTVATILYAVNFPDLWILPGGLAGSFLIGFFTGKKLEFRYTDIEEESGHAE